MGNQQASQRQQARVARVLDTAGIEVDMEAVAAMSPEEQKKVIVDVMQQLEAIDKSEGEVKPAVRARVRAEARKLNARLEFLERMERAKKVAATFPEGGIRYVCHATDDPRAIEGDEFEFTCKPYGFSPEEVAAAEMSIQSQTDMAENQVLAGANVDGTAAANRDRIDAAEGEFFQGMFRRY